VIYGATTAFLCLLPASVDLAGLPV
jgi:hypothetical protein